MARPPLDERLHHVRVPVGAGEVQRGVAVSILVVGIDSAREDGLDIIYLAVSVTKKLKGAPKMSWQEGTRVRVYHGGASLTGNSAGRVR